MVEIGQKGVECQIGLIRQSVGSGFRSPVDITKSNKIREPSINSTMRTQREFGDKALFQAASYK